MKIEIRQRDKRALLGLAGALVVYFAVSFLAIPAFNRVKAGANTVNGKEDELRKYRRAFVNRDHYAQLLEQVRKSVSDAESRLIRGDNASLAQVELQNVVEDSEKKVNIPLAPYSVSPPKKKDEYFNEMTISLTFDGTPNQLVSFLAALREAPKFVTVRNLQIAPVHAATEAPVKGELDKNIHANLTISALLASPPAAPKG